MTNLELLDILGGVRGKYILQAQQLRSREPYVHRWSWKRTIVLFAAVLALMTMLCGTAMAVSEDFRNYVFDLIGIFLPPKTETIMIEGLEEEIKYSSFGEIPDSTGPGFAIYNDYGDYTMTEENGVYYIRPIPIEGVDSSKYPPCEMVIEHSDTDWQTLCAQTREQMIPIWETVREVGQYENPERLVFTAQNGLNWDSPVEDHYFLPDGKTCCYHITARFFLEAVEGHGSRFAAMVATFTLVTDQDMADVEHQNAVRKEISDLAKDFAEAYFNRDTETIAGFLVEDYQWGIDVFSGGEVISDILVKQISGVEDTEIGAIHVMSVEFRESDQPDRLQYLTIEFVRRADGWKVQSYGLEG
ncbi:MAG: hypothetical protein ACI4D3_01270 [Lachnospiraceae bacterium]